MQGVGAWRRSFLARMQRSTSKLKPIAPRPAPSTTSGGDAGMRPQQPQQGVVPTHPSGIPGVPPGAMAVQLPYPPPGFHPAAHHPHPHAQPHPYAMAMPMAPHGAPHPAYAVHPAAAVAAAAAGYHHHPHHQAAVPAAPPQVSHPQLSAPCFPRATDSDVLFAVLVNSLFIKFLYGI